MVFILQPDVGGIFPQSFFIHFSLKIFNNMELSGLNKALHSLRRKRISVEQEASTRQEIVLITNVILGKMKECDHDKTFVFKFVTEKVLQGISSQRYEVYTVLRNLEKMVEVVDAVEEGNDSHFLHSVRLITAAARSCSL